MVVLGIDPGLAALGWALVEIAPAPVIVGAATVRTSAADPIERRIADIVRALPWETADLIAIEDQRGAYAGHQQRGTTSAAARLVLLVQGVAMGLCHYAPIVLVTPQQAQRAVTAQGRRADKGSVAAYVATMPGCPARISQHAADAVAVAVAGGRVMRMRARRR